MDIDIAIVMSLFEFNVNTIKSGRVDGSTVTCGLFGTSL